MIWKAIVRVEDGEAYDIQMKELGYSLIAYDDPPAKSSFGGFWISVEYDDEEEKDNAS